MRKVIYDQDGLEHYDHNLYGLLALLRQPDVEVVGITTVSGRQWSPRQVPRALRVLELLGQPQVPVAEGAVFPLVNTPPAAGHWQSQYGFLFDAGCLFAAPDTPEADRDPFFVPELADGPPQTAPVPVSAAEFLVEQVRVHPGEISLIATGPLTNLALACRLDGHFASRVQELVFVGGCFHWPRRGPGLHLPGRWEFNFRHDPEAAHIVLQADWPQVTCLPLDVTRQPAVSLVMHDAMGRDRSPCGRFAKRLRYECHAKGDAYAVAVWSQPQLVSDDQIAWMDVDLTHGPHYGATLSGRMGEEEVATRPIRVVAAIDEEGFRNWYGRLFSAEKPSRRGARSPLRDLAGCV